MSKCWKISSHRKVETNERTARLYGAAEKLKGIKGQSNLARFLSISPQILNNWESRGVPSKGLVEAAKAVGTSVEWLEAGTDSMDGSHTPGSNATVIGTVDVWDSRTPLSGDDCEVSFYKGIHLAAGNGFSDGAKNYSGYKLRFSKATLRRRGISPAAMICICVDDDNMEPVFPDGATLGINTAGRTVKDEKIYAVNHGGLLRTKILQELPGDKVHIRSYSAEAYPNEEADAAGINIIGHVFW